MPRLEALAIAPRNTMLEVVDSIATLRELRPAWFELWRRCPGATPFQSPDWLLPWCQHLGEGALRVFVLRHRDNALVGLAPFLLGHDTTPDPRVLSLLGTGVSDYGEALVAPGYEAQFVAAFSAALEERDEWARLDWQQMRPHSPLFAALPPAAQITAHEPCPVLKLHDRAPVQFSDGWRKKLDYDRRRLERTTRLRFERADSHNLDELFRALLRLHAARWQITGRSGVLADAHVRAFHAEVVSAMHASGTLRFYALRADDAIVACYYGFLTGGRAYYYLGGFDPAWERFGVGHQVVAHAIEEAAREGATEFDFLRGREPYKYRWGARDTPTRRAWLRR